MAILPEDEDWSIDRFVAEVDALQQSPPPAPEGMELIECTAEPRHWPTYSAHVDGMYPAACPACAWKEQDDALQDLRHRLEHRPWHRWAFVGKVAHILYPLGVISGSSHSWNTCPKCPEMHRLYWRGERPYVLGKPRRYWSHLLEIRGHMPTLMRNGWLCSTCAPCATCGSTDSAHEWCDS